MSESVPDPQTSPDDGPDGAERDHHGVVEEALSGLNRDALKDQYRTQMLNSIGGLSGTVIAAIPTLVFVVANAKFGLRPAVISAVGSALLLTLYRLIRRQSVQQALSGLFGVVVAALIASRTGHAKNYFLVGIWTSFIYGGALLASVVARRPLAGLFWEFLDPTPQSSDAPTDTEVAWYHRPPLFRAYMLATGVGAAVFLIRGIVQQTLFQHNSTGWLAVAKIGLGLPPYFAALAFGVWLVRRARTELNGAPEQDLRPTLPPD